MTITTPQRTLLPLVLMAVLMVGTSSCIKADPFQAPGAGQGTTEPDATEPDATEPDATEPDATVDADASTEDVPPPCTSAGCECEEDEGCDDDLVCSDLGTCCAPACEGKVCGADGCGGICGECEEGDPCTDEGLCQFCTAGDTVCNGNKVAQCDDDGTGYKGSGSDCKLTSPEKPLCLDGKCVCAPDCEMKECGDDGCGGSCGDCSGGKICSGTHTCITEECSGQDPICLEDEPGLVFECVDGLLPDPTEDEPLFDCASEEDSTCEIHWDLIDSQTTEDEALLYCACTEGEQVCISDENLLLCASGKWTPIACADLGKDVCDPDVDACVAAEPDNPGDVDCCVAKCGFHEECGGVCTCAAGATCYDEVCYGECEQIDLGTGQCLSDDVIAYCQSKTVDGNVGLWWTPSACEANHTCEEADEGTYCANDEPSPGDAACCEKKIGECGYIDACGGVCGCGEMDGAFCYEADGICLSPCTNAQNGSAHCISEDVMENCTAYTVDGTDGNYWVPINCPAENGDDSQCVDGDFGEPASCSATNIGTSDDTLAMPFNYDMTQEPDQFGMVGADGAATGEFSLPVGNQDGPLTINLWLWSHGFETDQAYTLLSKGGRPIPGDEFGEGGADEWILFVSEQRFYFQIYDGSGAAWWRRSKPIPAGATGQWIHLVVSYKGLNKTFASPHSHTMFWLNGNNFSESASAWGKSNGASATYTVSSVGTNHVYVGTDSATLHWFYGGMDDLAIIKKHLSGSQAKSMSEPSGGCGSDLTQLAFSDQIVAYWRFEDLVQDSYHTESLVGDHTLSFMSEVGAALDSPCWLSVN